MQINDYTFKQMAVGGAFVLSALSIGCGERAAVLHVSTKMRSEASSKSKSVAVLAEDSVVDIVGTSSDWIEVRSGKKTGFLLACLAAQVPASGVDRHKEHTTEAGKLYAAYRKAPRKSDDALAKLETITSKYESTKFYPLALKALFREKASRGDKDALAGLSELKKSCPARIDAELVEEARRYGAKSDQMKQVVSALSVSDKRTVWIAGNKVTVRAFPSKSSESAGALDYGTKVTVKERLGDYVRVSGKTSGWLRAKDTTNVKPVSVAGSYVIKAFEPISFQRVRIKQNGRAISGTVFDDKGREFAYKGAIVGDRVSFECAPIGRKSCSFKGFTDSGKIKGTLVTTGMISKKEHKVTLAAK